VRCDREQYKGRCRWLHKAFNPPIADCGRREVSDHNYFVRVYVA
jgi:hypothetical protein